MSAMQGPAYGAVDRLVHRVAFGGGPGPRLLRDLETRIYRDRIARAPVDAPVFVTALPRAGTTLLLEILSRHPDVVTHSYRDMPFVLSPLVWRKLSGRFRVQLERRERAHSDGVFVDADSPEAFEEVFWLAHAPEHYTARGIRLWPDSADDFSGPLAEFIRRLIASREAQGGAARRYVSKNNANIARLPALGSAFGDGHVLVPFRPPLDHAISLRNQHLRFLDMHGQSAFAEAYMRDIGHFEFGKLHRPILFPGMEEILGTYSPGSLDYWIAYWLCAYRHIAGQRGVTFVDMQRFCATAPVAQLFDHLDLAADGRASAAAAKLVRPMAQYDVDEKIDTGLARRARALFEELRMAGSCAP